MTICKEGFELYLYSEAEYHLRSNIHIFKSIVFLKGTFLLFTQETIRICAQKHIAQTNYLIMIIHSQVRKFIWSSTLLSYNNLPTLSALEVITLKALQEISCLLWIVLVSQH